MMVGMLEKILVVEDDIYKLKGLGIGADDYIGKPFIPSELVSRVVAHINRITEKIEIDSSNPQFIETVWDMVIDLIFKLIFLRGLV